jgi:hypothetical protein
MSAGPITSRSRSGPRSARVQRAVARRSELGETFGGGRLALQPGEHADRGVERGLRALDLLVGFAHALLARGAATRRAGVFAHGV